LKKKFFPFFFFVLSFSFGQQGKNIDLDEVVNIAGVIPQIYLNDDVYSFKDRDTLLKKLLRLPFWKGFTEFKINLEDFETGKAYSFESKGPLRIFINTNELTKRHLFKTFTSIRELNRKIEKVEIRTDEEKKNVEIFKKNYINENNVTLPGGIVFKEIKILESESDSKAFPVTHVKITANLSSKTLYNRISKKEIKLTQEFEQAGSIALDNIEVVQKATDDDIVYSPKYIDGQITFEKNNELTDYARKSERYLEMGLNMWGIDVNALTWAGALRGVIGAKASGGMSAGDPPQGGIPILINNMTLGTFSPLPLFVIDGTPLIEPPASVQSLSPLIRKVNVLKYAEASFYGARGAAGVIEITTVGNGFNNSLNKKRSYNVKGKKNRELMIEYQKLESQFKLKIEQLKTQKKYAYENENKIRMDSFQKLIDNTISKSYLYTANFALTYSNHEIAPYLAYTKIGDANISLLDSIARTLSPKAMKSKYGKKFLSLIRSRKTIQKE
jgi:hypothetical protein